MAIKDFENNNASLLLDTGEGYQYDISSSLSPFGPTGGSIMAQSGRSMVEMLGTLAIIGVLSIGGIAGYSYGMDKYKANQTINDIMLMSVDIITQLSQNRGEPTLSTDWGTKTSAGYDFTVVQNPTDDTQYGIQITGVSSRICKMVGDGLKQTVAVYVGSDDYNADTETDPCDESNSNTMEFYFGNTGDGTCTQTCASCQICSNGKCVDKTDGESCLNGICQNGICINNSDEPYSNKECNSNDDCGECAYCSDSWGACRAYYQSDNIPCDNGRGICADRAGNQAVCVTNKTCKTNTDCDEFGKDYYCGMVTDDTWTLEVTNNYQCTKLSFSNHIINGHNVFVSTRTLLFEEGAHNSISAKNACARMRMNVVDADVLCNNYTPSNSQYSICEGWHIICSKENIF